MASASDAQLKAVLEKIYARYNRYELISPDPLQFVYRYDEPLDREMAGFIAAALAYGRVAQIQRSVDRLLGFFGDHPHNFVSRFSEQNAAALTDFKHRFNTGQDIAELLTLLRQVLNEYGSIEAFFAKHHRAEDRTIIPAMTAFCDDLAGRYTEKYQRKISRGVKYLLASPARGSASKRLNLFLRWMVRSDDVDPGIWKSINPGKLIVPIDVHMGRLCKILGLYDRSTVSLKTAIEITENFARLQPDDPVKYDFSLSRIGIIDNCTGQLADRCDICELYGYCLKVKND